MIALLLRMNGVVYYLQIDFLTAVNSKKHSIRVLFLDGNFNLPTFLLLDEPDHKLWSNVQNPNVYKSVSY